jgi:hypothetical protein
MKDPWRIAVDELWMEFFVCRQNKSVLEKSGPYCCLQFLKSLIRAAKNKREMDRVVKITSIIHKEKM